ncbi:hypothetical protein PZA18_22915 [Chitinimonas sp. DQS-5]|uniref:Uncharacterized protein n=2 Tax=Parachitinimonas caeni TaxID=3031301 RepID=A0ABT7E3S7_9NEIS|nr:hypothetical protein [Parachitinimonas caeni]
MRAFKLAPLMAAICTIPLSLFCEAKLVRMPSRGNEIITMAISGKKILVVTLNGDLYCTDKHQIAWQLCHQVVSKEQAKKMDDYVAWGDIITGHGNVVYRVAGVYENRAMWESRNSGVTWRETQVKQSKIFGTVSQNGDLYFQFTNEGFPLGVYVHKLGSREAPQRVPGTESVGELCALGAHKDTLYFGHNVITGQPRGGRLTQSPGKITKRNELGTDTCQFFSLELKKPNAVANFSFEYTGRISVYQDDIFSNEKSMFIGIETEDAEAPNNKSIFFDFYNKSTRKVPVEIWPKSLPGNISNEKQNWYLEGVNNTHSIWYNDKKNGIFLCNSAARNCKQLPLPSSQPRISLSIIHLSKSGEIYICTNQKYLFKWMKDERKWEKILDNKILNVYPKFLPSKAR